MVLAEHARLHPRAEDVVEGLTDTLTERLGKLCHRHPAESEHLSQDQGNDLFLLEEVVEVAFAVGEGTVLDRGSDGEMGADAFGHLFQDLADDARVERLLEPK